MINRQENYSWAELKAIFGERTQAWISFRVPFADSHSEWVSLIEEAVDYIGQAMVNTREIYQQSREDALTIHITEHLKDLNFDAGHETKRGGHCDIVVYGKQSYLWVAEAKIHRDYDWLLAGVDQLLTRYASGLVGQDSGELLIYHFGRRTDTVVDHWEQRLREAHPEAGVSRCKGDDQVLRSTHKHEGTGRPYRVRHKALSLYFDPKK
ncbi:hypothetical protein [Rhizobium leguminosarum]|uniref:hypothetical protein n=1 Tax=Rhizobium leguminosarum TaxID=384 RepID=UPI001C9827C1|nr:hypothetical protein [Rhizobium leguminosarum]MBY5700544.1 hypothetical protein [Rhizobium leguminosarum]